MSPSDPDFVQAPHDRPSTEEMAAIVAAVEMAWPRPVVVEAAEDKPPMWRFSGRWWLPRRPVAAARRRP